jgi:hypothetical protein
MERKISEQKKQIESLYDDLESKEQFIEMVEGDLKNANRQATQYKKALEEERRSQNENEKQNDDLKTDTISRCPNGCDKYNKSVDDIYNAGVEHKNELLELKQIADEQKVKISCLRNHRDEIKDDFYKLKEVHETEMKESWG